MKMIELFAGSRSVGVVAESMGYEVFSTDLKPFTDIHLAKDILEIEPSDFPFVPDVLWSSPPCTFFSVGSIGKHWHKDHSPKTDEALLGVKIVKKTLDIIDHFLSVNPDMKWFMENPRGKLRKLPVVAGRDKTTIWYCQYGDIRAKPTDIWSNYIASVFSKGWQPRPECFNGNTNCHHQPAPRGSQTGTQGLANAYEKSKIPSELIEEILCSLN